MKNFHALPHEAGEPHAIWFAAGLAFAALVAAACGGNSNSPAGADEGPVALVDVVVARQGVLTEDLVAYGTVIPAPGSVQSFSVPFESIIRSVLVSEGQQVGRGTSILLLEPSADARLQIEQARTALTAEQVRLDNTQQRFELGLATSDELAQQQQALGDARARFETLDGWLQSGRITAPGPGVVSQVLVAQGALVPAGTSLLNLAVQNRFEVRLGVEPEDVRLVRVGQPVFIDALNRSLSAAGVAGTVRSVAQQVDPATRLVEVLVAPPPGFDALLLGEYVRGHIEIADQQGLIVPRSALLPEEDRYVLFTVHGGRAFKQVVRLGIETDTLAQVSGAGLAAGDSVVVLGNYVLADSLRVRTRPSGSASTDSMSTDSMANPPGAGP